MKKILLGLSLMTCCTLISRAQISSRGLPLSMLTPNQVLANQQVTPILFATPTLDQIMLDDAKASRLDPKPYRAGVLVPTDISFPSSGSIVTLADGRQVWKATVQFAGAPALAFYYDQFQLPPGVQLFLSNSNGQQIIGAFTEKNNSDDGLFANQEIQGDVVNLELNIAPGVDLDAIRLHINQAAVMYRSIDYLQQYAISKDIALRPTADFAAGSSSVCEINAMCSDGQNYEQQRKATMRIIMPLGGNFVGFCTGTLINNTKGDCTPYVLTASHCEGGNSKINSAFSQWIFYFNFESPDCAGEQVAPNNRTMTGANFVARADYDSSTNTIIGDFLMLQLKTKVPESYGAYLAGWNRADNLPTNTKYINFHHPSGDMKKLAVTNTIAPNGTFNQNRVRNTHWAVNFDIGGNEGGSSGSALFDTDGRIVGDLSGGSNEQFCAADTNGRGEVTILGKDAVYSKFNRNWEYPEGNGLANTQLKPWLDPDNTGAMTTNALKSAAVCNAPVTGITNNANALDQFVRIYPNPVTNGNVWLKVNFDKATDLTLTIYDINGARKDSYKITKAVSGDYHFDMNAYANGTYLIAIDNGTTTTTKKISLVH